MKRYREEDGVVVEQRDEENKRRADVSYRTDPRAYNNRATCYTKLMAFPEALKDADEAIKIDPTFIKAYIRKSLVQAGMKEHAKALETLQLATEKDTEKKVSSFPITLLSERKWRDGSLLKILAYKRARNEYAESYE